MKTVKVSAKGQIALPAAVTRALNIKKGTELLLMQRGETIILVPAEKAAERVFDEFGGWSNLSAPAFNKLWDNEEDEIWNEA